MIPKRDPQIGEKVWIEPSNSDVPVPFETRLRGGVKSGQLGHPYYPPSKNQVLPQHRVRKLRGPEEVEWSEWWRRRFNQGDVKFAAKPKKSGGDK